MTPLDRLLTHRIAILDGAMGTMIKRLGLDERGFRGGRFASHPRDLTGNLDVLVLTRPDVIGAIHREYLAAGADIIETNSFNANGVSQAEYGLESLVYDLNVAAARLARDAVDDFRARTPDCPRFVAGALGPTHRTLSMAPDASHPAFRVISFDAMTRAYVDQVRGLIDGGVDLLLLETVVDALSAKAAIVAIQEVQDEKGVALPLMISFTITDRSGRIHSGQTIDTFYSAMEHARPWSIGINCAPGAADMRPYVEALSRIASCWISAHPNAGLPNARGEYDEPPDRIAQLLHDVAAGGFANILGGCCGTTPDHIAAIARAVEGLPPRRRPTTSPDGREPLHPSGFEPLIVRADTTQRPVTFTEQIEDTVRTKEMDVQQGTLLPIAAARENHLKTDWDNLQIPVPWFVGRRIVRPSIADLAPLIDWTFFFSAWQLHERYPAILEHPVHGPAARDRFDRAQVILARIVEHERLKARGVYGFWPANTRADDIVVYKDDARATELVRFHMLRQQDVMADGHPNRSLADFIAPRDSFAPDYIGAFAVTAGIGADELVREHENQHDDQGAMLVKAIAERLAEAFAEYLHAQVRRDWGYAKHEALSSADLLAQRYRGIRPAFGHPASPDHSEKPALFRLLHAEQEGIALTESFAMTPMASVSGIYLSHPEAAYFDVGRLGQDQIADYAERKGVTVEQAERWLAANLGY